MNQPAPRKLYEKRVAELTCCGLLYKIYLIVCRLYTAVWSRVFRDQTPAVVNAAMINPGSSNFQMQFSESNILSTRVNCCCELCIHHVYSSTSQFLSHCCPRPRLRGVSVTDRCLVPVARCWEPLLQCLPCIASRWHRPYQPPRWRLCYDLLTSGQRLHPVSGTCQRSVASCSSHGHAGLDPGSHQGWGTDAS